MLIKIIGLVAASLTTFAFLPQAIKTWRSKSTHDLSPLMFSMLCLGILLWLIYGIVINDLTIILANGVTLGLASTIMYFIIKDNKPKTIHHIALWTKNLEDMKSFYTKNFDATASDKYVNTTRNFSSYFIRFSAGCQLELMHQPDKENYSGPNGHFALSVGGKKSVNNYVRNLSEKGYKIVSQPRTTGDGYYEAVIEDIEGNLIEITS